MKLSKLNVRMKQLLTTCIVVTLLAVVLLLATPATVEAATCYAWQNTGTCCDSPYWPGQQDVQKRQCFELQYSWWEYRCATFTVCP